MYHIPICKIEKHVSKLLVLPVKHQFSPVINFREFHDLDVTQKTQQNFEPLKMGNFAASKLNVFTLFCSI